jgi:DNA-binding PadR family transcriptional regulator
LIFDAENGERLIARRFRAAGISPDSAVQPVESGGLNLLSDIDWFRATIAEQRANFVVFDSLRVLTSGAKESDSDEMEPFVTGLKMLARETQAAIMLIHHRGKSDLSEFRGSSVIRDQTDLLFTFGRVGGDPEARTRRKLTTIKCRIEEEPEPRWLRIVAERDRGLVSLDEAEAYDPEEDTGRPRDDHRGSVLALLEVEAPRSGRSIADELGASEPTIRRVLHDLESDGLAAKHGAGRGAGWVLRQRVTPLGVDALTQFEFGSTEPNSPPRNASRENGAPPAMFDPHSEWS